jgi:hypothetical protein
MAPVGRRWRALSSSPALQAGLSFGDIPMARSGSAAVAARSLSTPHGAPARTRPLSRNCDLRRPAAADGRRSPAQGPPVPQRQASGPSTHSRSRTGRSETSDRGVRSRPTAFAQGNLQRTPLAGVSTSRGGRSSMRQPPRSSVTSALTAREWRDYEQAGAAVIPRGPCTNAAV